MALLSAKKELVTALEKVAGETTTGDLADAANADILVSTAEPTLDVEFFDREYLRSTISKLKSVPGQLAGGVTATFELQGNDGDSFAAGVPAWTKFMEMAGYRRVAIGRATAAGSASQTSWSESDGPLRHGEIIEDSVGATARIVGDVPFGQRTFFYEPLSGSVSASNTPWTTSDTEISVVMSGSPAAAGDRGWAWLPVSESLKQLTATGSISVVAGDVYRGDGGAGGAADDGAVIVIAEDSSSSTTVVYRAGSVAPVDGEVFNLASGSGPASFTAATPTNEDFKQWPTGSIRLNEDGVALDFVACRGNISFNFEVNRPVTATFTARGRWSTGDSGESIDGVGDAPLLGGAPEVLDPKVWQGQAIGIGINETISEMHLEAEEVPCLKSMSLDSGVTLTDVKCAASENGLLEIIGSSRSGSGSLETNATVEEEIPWLTTLRSGEVVRLKVQVGGAPTTVGGLIFQIPGIQYTGASSGDSDGILTRSMDFSLNGAVINNLGATPDGEISSTSGDNELIIIYSTDA